MQPQQTHAQRGTTLIEVLVAMVILGIGLLGLVGLQARLQTLQFESYQRSQALLLLNDMVDRLTSNRYALATYAAGATVANPVGKNACPTATPTTRAASDLKQWCESLKGAAETLGSTNVGAMVGGRGCVEDLGDGDYLVTVAWQGFSPISAPPEGVACGAGAYNDVTACDNDLCRRAVTSLVRFAQLDAP